VFRPRFGDITESDDQHTDGAALGRRLISSTGSHCVLVSGGGGVSCSRRVSVTGPVSVVASITALLGVAGPQRHPYGMPAG
jgi:hypothetical protein